MPNLPRVVPALVLLLVSVPFWLLRPETAPAGAAPAAQISPTPVVVPPSVRQGTPTPVLVPPGQRQPATATPAAQPTSPPVPNLGPAPPGRFFPESGYAIRDDAFWSFFNSYGGVRTFGYPISRQFQFL